MKAATLGEIADWGSGGTPKRGVADYFGDGTPWLSIADLNDGVVTTAKESITASGIANSSAKVVPPGTIFVAMYGSIGKLGIAGSEMATSQAIAFAKPKEGVVDRRFLFHYLLAERPKLQSLGRGGTQMNIGQADLKAWPILLPSLPEQRRIAAILDQADAIRTKRRRLLALLGNLEMATFEWLFSSTSAEETSMGELVAEQLIGLDRRAELQGRDRAHRYLKMDAITNDWRLNLEAVTGIDASPSEVRRYSLRDGDFLFNTRNSLQHVGKSVVYRGAPALFNNNLMRVRFQDSVLPDYVHGFLRSHLGRAQLHERKSGTTNVVAIYAKSFATVRVPVPSLAEQHRYARALLAIGRQQDVVRRALAADDELFASLQGRAFAGDL